MQTNVPASQGVVQSRANEENKSVTMERTTETTTEAVKYTTEKIIRLMQENPRITNKELAVACGITEDCVYWNIGIPRNNNIIRLLAVTLEDIGSLWNE